MAAFYEKKSEKIFFQASFHGYSLNIDKQSLKKNNNKQIKNITAI